MNIPSSGTHKRTIALSIQQRLSLIDTLNRMPLPQFLEIESALAVPVGVMPAYDAPLGQRSAILLQWLEGSTGLGLPPLLEVLSLKGIDIFDTSTFEPDDSNDKLIRIKLDGDFDEVDREKLQEILFDLQKMAKDRCSVEIESVRRGSIEITLRGSEDALEAIADALEDSSAQVAGMAVESISSQEAIPTKGGLCLRGADLHKTNFAGVNLSGADLTEANLRDANLTGTDLTGADLSRANLTGADLSRANLDTVKVTRTIFKNNIGISRFTQLRLTKEGAIFQDPPRLATKSPATGPLNNISVVIQFRNGSFDTGFSANVQMLCQEVRIDEERRLAIPPAPAIPKLYQMWKDIYQKSSGITRRFSIPAEITKQPERSETKNAIKQLQSYLENQWFNTPGFEIIRHWITSRIQIESNRLIPVAFDFETGNLEQDSILKRLPWSCWDLFRHSSNLEPTLASSCFRIITSPLTNRINILAIYGSDEGGLNLEEEQAAISGLLIDTAATVTYVLQPTLEKLHTLLIDGKENWDILFFAGHSFSNPSLSLGYLQLNPGQAGIVSLEDLRPALEVAARKGLKIAIFNSWDGLGTVDYLEKELKIPCVIAFKEAVPDLAARKFFRSFLEEFRQGTPLYRSVKQARAGMAWMEGPDVSWLPVVCQNPCQPEFVWKSKLVIVAASKIAAAPEIAAVLEPKLAKWILAAIVTLICTIFWIYNTWNLPSDPPDPEIDNTIITPDQEYR